MPSQSDRDSWLYVEDMRTFCERVLEYTRNVERETFAADLMRYDATLRNLELIGEAATYVPDELRTRAPGIPWRQVVNTQSAHPRLSRHRYRHRVEHRSRRHPSAARCSSGVAGHALARRSETL
jgi:hypothetical protein